MRTVSSDAVATIGVDTSGEAFYLRDEEAVGLVAEAVPGARRRSLHATVTVRLQRLRTRRGWHRQWTLIYVGWKLPEVSVLKIHNRSACTALERNRMTSNGPRDLHDRTRCTSHELTATASCSPRAKPTTRSARSVGFSRRHSPGGAARAALADRTDFSGACSLPACRLRASACRERSPVMTLCGDPGGLNWRRRIQRNVFGPAWAAPGRCRCPAKRTRGTQPPTMRSTKCDPRLRTLGAVRVELRSRKDDVSPKAG